MFKDICRLCGKNSATQNSLRIFENKNVLWSIQVITGLILENAKCLPELICIGCQTELRQAIEFSDKVIATQKQLLLALTEEELQEVSQEYKTTVTELAISSCEKSISRNNPETQVEIDEESIIETNLMAGDIIIEDQEKHEDLWEYDIIVDDETIVNEAELDVRTLETIETFTDEDQYALANDPDGNPYMLPEKEWTDDSIILTNQLKDEIVEQPPNTVKNKRGQKRLGNLVYVCDECGIHISGRVAFDLHCRRHRGEKQFECTICQDRFCTSSELKSHMRRHTGERPFPCHYCDRYFADNSTRIKHERTHTNERPYACESCGKAFTTTYILKNHMLIHSGERAFSCEPCNKTFRRHTHLVTHFRSRAHKRKRERQNNEILNTS